MNHQRLALRCVVLCVTALAAACQRPAAPSAASAGSAPAPAVASAPAASTPRSAMADSFYAGALEHRPSIAQLTGLGRRLFADPVLSASGRVACRTCHDPQHAYGPANALAVQPGGADLHANGLRAAPSLRYLENAPPFGLHYFDEATDESVDQGPVGGHTWDGRADTVHDQARLPLLSRAEMANGSADEVAARVAPRYGDDLKTLFGAHVLDSPDKIFNALLLALEIFQQNPADFAPFSSRYDAWLRGQGKLSAREMRGLALFNDPARANCANCHPSQIRQGSFPLFTDFGYAALGVPRNRALAVNQDPQFFDLGLCGPERRDLVGHREYCGMFRVPTLRNVTLRRTFFHNGAMHDLRQVVEFYATRDTAPQDWYGRDAAGHARQFDDLPATYASNVNREPPFDRQPGQKSVLSATEIGDIVAFLGTLTDGDLLATGASARGSAR